MELLCRVIAEVEHEILVGGRLSWNLVWLHSKFLFLLNLSWVELVELPGLVLRSGQRAVRLLVVRDHDILEAEVAPDEVLYVIGWACLPPPTSSRGRQAPLHP